MAAKINRKDWRNIDITEWNTLTFTVYFTDMNRDMFGVDYAPQRNWSFERGVIKNALDRHGTELLKRCFDVIFREYRPTREFPVLTAGFAIAYRLNTVLPRIKADLEREQARAVADASGPDADEVRAWL